MLEHEGLSGRIIGAAIAVHRTLGPGFLEKIYEEALCIELEKRRIVFARQKRVPVVYDGIRVGKHDLDLFVEDVMVVELEAIRAIDDSHFAVVRSYLEAVGRRHGLLLNFGRPRLDVRRVIAEVDDAALAQVPSCAPNFLHSLEEGLEDDRPE